MMLLAVPSGALPAAIRPRVGTAPVVRRIERRPASRPIGAHRPTPPRGRSSAPGGEVLFGSVPLGAWTTTAMPFPECYRKIVGTEKPEAYLLYRPGVFDWQIPRWRVGNVEHWVHLWIDHEAGSKLCSTCSGALVVKPTPTALLFMVTAETGDGRAAIRAAKSRTRHREVSPGVYPLEFEWGEGEPGEPGYLVVTRGRLHEISLVPRGAFPGTTVMVG